MTVDPNALIVAAVTAGVTELAKGGVSLAIKDAYGKLKDLLKKRFGGKPAAETALQQVEKKPEVWKEPLKDAVAESGADKDEAIVQAAQALLKLVQPQQVGAGKYNVQIGEGKGIVVGDDAQVTMTFGDEPKEKPKP